jgi:hypothetical protein
MYPNEPGPRRMLEEIQRQANRQQTLEKLTNPLLASM